MRIATCLAFLTSLALAGAEDRAARLLAKGDAEGAKKAASKVLEKSPHNERAWLVLVDALVQLGEPEDAWGELEDNALPKNPKSAALLVKLGDVFAVVAQKIYRESQVDAMVDKLAATRFLAVVGTSGSGKSSLVNCGLRPALHRGSARTRPAANSRPR